MWADLPGADPRLAGAPGESTCISCHGGGTPLNGGPGSVSIATSSTYTSGVKQRITVTASDSGQRRFGFELTARLSSNLINGQAGTLGARGQCRADHLRQLAQGSLDVGHNGAICDLHATGSSFSIDWTPPATANG